MALHAVLNVAVGVGGIAVAAYSRHGARKSRHAGDRRDTIHDDTRGSAVSVVVRHDLQQLRHEPLDLGAHSPLCLWVRSGTHDAPCGLVGAVAGDPR
jgi:hypothetical protein